MAISQLYYTSCEHGLSAYPGFQFNAASPGLDSDIMREVERLTSYEQPPSLTASATAEQLAACPVKLRYQPGPATVLARVVFVGADYSRRFGNYFAHTLVTDRPATDLAAVLPIELFRADHWVDQPVTDPTLGELSPAALVPRLGRADTARALAGHPARDRLATLLTAVWQSVRNEDDRQVVVVDRDGERVAQWIAAAAFLLPPDLVRSMSFSTYERQPRYSSARIIGAIGESEVDRNDSGFEAYYLFDFLSGRSSDLTPSRAAQVLSEIDIARADEMWRRVGELAAGSERTPDDWYPVLLAALVDWDGGGDAAREDPEELCRWVARNASRLQPATVRQLVETALVLLSGSTDSAPLRDLGQAADAVRAADLREQIEEVSVAVAIRLARSGRAPAAGELPAVRSVGARKAASEELTQLLPGSPPAVAAALVTVATELDAELQPEVLETTGRDVLGPAALAVPGDVSVRRAIEAVPAVRAGVRSYLTGRIESEGLGVEHVLVGAMSDGLVDILGCDERSPGSRLDEMAVLARVNRGDLPPADAFGRVYRGRRAGGSTKVVDRSILLTLWPSGKWTPDEALAVLAQLAGPGEAGTEVLAWLGAAATRGDGDTATLVGALVAEGFDAHLPATDRKHLETVEKSGDRLNRVGQASLPYEGFVEVVRELVQLRGQGSARVVHDEIDQRLLRLLRDNRRGDRTLTGGRAAHLLVAFHDVRTAHLAELTEELTPSRGHRASPDAAAWCFHVRWHAGMAHVPRARIAELTADFDHLLRPVAAKWSGGALRTTRKRLHRLNAAHPSGKQVIEDFDHWADRSAPPSGGLFGLLGALRGNPGDGKPRVSSHADRQKRSKEDR